LIQFLKHNEINKSNWDEAINCSSNGLIYAYSWYLDIVCPGWDALIEDDYSSVMPLPRNRKYGFDYLFPPFFVQQLGVFSKSDNTEKKVQQFLKSIPAEFRYVEMNLNTENHFNGSGEFTLKENLTHHLVIDGTHDELRNNYSENVLRNIKKAEKNDLNIGTAYDYKSLIGLFRKNRGKKIDTLKDAEYKMFESLCSTVSIRKQMDMLSVYMGKELCAGMIVFKSNNFLIMIFSALNDAGKKCGAMHFAIDYYLKLATDKYQGYTFDFEGSNQPALARFYKSFGSVEKRYFQIKRNNLPKPLKWMKR